MNIVIVDSGIRIEHKIFENKNIELFEYVDDKMVTGCNDEFGHGTAISGIICHGVPNSRIIVVKLNNIENEGVDENDLINVLNYISCWEDINIINLSLGCNICEQYDVLYGICKKITDNGTIIVSAFDNSGSVSYPAAFENVIGVTTGQYCNRRDEFEFIENDPIVNIAAKGTAQRVAWTYPDYIMIGGNSFAAAHVTVQIAKFMEDGVKTKEQILMKFKETCVKQYTAINRKVDNHQLFGISKAVIFPFNKEMHSLIRYSNMLHFKIADVYDSKYSATVGAATRHLMKDKAVENFVIKNIDDINWDSFDTLILGHLDELSSLIDKENLKNDLVQKALMHNKYIYAFDDLSALGYENCERIYYPKIDSEDLPTKRYGMLYRISKPVVGVFGTSSQQGKFTLQLKLRELFLEQGYQVGQIGTEPSALLYGMDYCYPMGYNSSIFIKEFDVIRYLNSIMNDLCLKDNDIILVGSQSGTIPYDTGNIVQYTIPQFNFLMGTLPDCVVLCVNPFDNIQYVQRTLDFIESSADCKVVAIVVFPMDLKEGWMGLYSTKETLSEKKYEELRYKLHKQFNVPVFKLGNEDNMRELAEVIVEFFAE